AERAARRLEPERGAVDADARVAAGDHPLRGILRVLDRAAEGSRAHERDALGHEHGGAQVVLRSGGGAGAREGDVDGEVLAREVAGGDADRDAGGGGGGGGGGGSESDRH